MSKTLANNLILVIWTNIYDMKIIVKVIPIQEINGMLHIVNAANVANDDSFRSGRLLREGNKTELAKTEAEPLYYMVEDYEIEDDLIRF